MEVEAIIISKSDFDSIVEELRERRFVQRVCGASTTYGLQHLNKIGDTHLPTSFEVEVTGRWKMTLTITFLDREPIVLQLKRSLF